MSAAPTTCRLVDRRSGRVIVPRLEVADTFWRRLVGLQFRRHLPADGGLLLTPCGAVHTFFLRLAIDVVQIAADGRVLAIRRDVRPWRVVGAAAGTRSVLELPAGAAASAGLAVGDMVEVAATPR